MTQVLSTAQERRRTGILTVEKGQEQAEIRLVSGKVISIRGPQSLPLKDLLIQEGLVDSHTLQLALDLQDRVRPRRALDRILVSTGVLDKGDLNKLISSQVECMLQRVLDWTEGSFIFTLGSQDPMESTHAGDLLASVDFDLAEMLKRGGQVSADLGKKVSADRADDVEEENLWEGLSDSSISVMPPMAPLSDQSLGRIRQILAEVRSGVHSGTVALYLMQILSEILERAVLFLVEGRQLRALGAFGLGYADQPMARLVKGLVLDLDQLSRLDRTLRGGVAEVVSFDRALPDSVAALMGPPKRKESLLLPVSGVHESIAIIYADNGSVNRAIRGTELLEVAATQIGLVFENEMLRTQLEKKQRQDRAQHSRV